MLKWPLKLEHFALHWAEIRTGKAFTLADAQALLWKHRGSVKSIRIGGWPGTALGRYSGVFPCANIKSSDAADFSSFTRLESFTLNAHILAHSYSAKEIAMQLLSAPQLHTFVWDFRCWSLEDGYETYLDEFDIQRSDWLLSLANTAHEKNFALRWIYVDFVPVISSITHLRRRIRSAKYSPWDLMHQLRVKLEPMGISLQYPAALNSVGKWKMMEA